MAVKIPYNQVNKKGIEIITRELKQVIDRNVTGDVVEFGCYLGGTSIFIADTLKSSVNAREFYVYDSFSGLPEKTKEDISPLGNNFRPGELLAPKKQFIKNILQFGVPMPIIKKAWFSDLTTNDVPKKISFVFLDGDYYASIVDPLKLVEGYLTPGATIVVDDYNNEALPGVTKAVDEWLLKHPAVKRVEQSLAIIYIPNR